MTKKELRSVALGASCSALFLYLALRSVDWRGLADAAARARAELLPVLVAGAVLTLGMRAERWRLLLGGKPSRSVMFRLITVGLAVNNVLPLRLGELARAGLASAELGFSMVSVLASILVERLLDAVTILSLFLCAAVFDPGSPWVDRIFPILLPIYGALLAVFIASFLLESFLERWASVREHVRRHPKLGRLVEQLIVGLRPLRSPVSLSMILIWGTGLWCVESGNYFLAGRAFPLGTHLSYLYAMVVLATAGMSTVVPLAPGYIGGFEYAVSEAIRPLGSTSEQALGYALLIHAVGYAVTTALGIYFLYREGNTLGGLWRQLKSHD